MAEQKRAKDRIEKRGVKGAERDQTERKREREENVGWRVEQERWKRG